MTQFWKSPEGLFWDQVNDESKEDDPMVNPLLGSQIEAVVSNFPQTEVFLLDRQTYLKFLSETSKYQQLCEKSLRNKIETAFGIEKVSQKHKAEF